MGLETKHPIRARGRTGDMRNTVEYLTKQCAMSVFVLGLTMLVTIQPAHGEPAPSEQPSQIVASTASGQSSLEVAEQAGDSGAVTDGARETHTLSSRARRMSPEPNGRNALGISFGLASGMGLSYRRYANDFIAIRVDGMVFVSGGTSLFSVGTTIQEDFLRTSNMRLYATEGVGIHRGVSERLLVGIGGGLGVEYDFDGLTRGFSLRGELVMTALIRPGGGLLMATPVPQIGGAYIF